MPDFKSEQLARQARRETVPNNPHGDDYARMQDDGLRFLVQSDSVGGLAAGKVVGRHNLQPGAQIQRLIDAGHLCPLTGDEAETLLQDPAAHPGPMPYPTATLLPPKPEDRRPVDGGPAAVADPSSRPVDGSFANPPKGDDKGGRK